MSFDELVDVELVMSAESRADRGRGGSFDWAGFDAQMHVRHAVRHRVWELAADPVAGAAMRRRWDSLHARVLPLDVREDAERIVLRDLMLFDD